MDVVINGRFLTQRITGVQRYARELVRGLDNVLDATPGFSVVVMSPQLTEPPPAWRNIKLQQVGHLTGHAWEQVELPLHSRGRLLFCPGNTAPVISLLDGQGVVATVHDLSYKYFPDAYSVAFRTWYGFIVPLVLRRAKDVITVSEAERRAILTHYPEAAPRLHAIANGGPLVGGSPIVKVGADSNYVLYVGSLSKRKNFSRLFEAACKLVRQRGLRFIFVGDASKNLVATMPKVPDDIAAKIEFVGAIEDSSALASYYRGALCLLFPSLYESSGLPPTEAMSCGCPVVVSDIPALRERCGDAAIYCDPNSVDSMVAAVGRIASDDGLSAKLRTLGYKRAASYTWEGCATETLTVLGNSS